MAGVRCIADLGGAGGHRPLRPKSGRSPSTPSTSVHRRCGGEGCRRNSPFLLLTCRSAGEASPAAVCRTETFRTPTPRSASGPLGASIRGLPTTWETKNSENLKSRVIRQISRFPEFQKFRFPGFHPPEIAPENPRHPTLFLRTRRLSMQIMGLGAEDGRRHSSPPDATPPVPQSAPECPRVPQSAPECPRVTRPGSPHESGISRRRAPGSGAGVSTLGERERCASVGGLGMRFLLNARPMCPT